MQASWQRREQKQREVDHRSHFVKLKLGKKLFFQYKWPLLLDLDGNLA